MPTTSVIIPTWRRTVQLRKTLEMVLACEPPPGEVCVHVDAGDDESPAMLKAEFTGLVRWLQAEKTRGPGGGRNVLAEMAKGDLLVSLDDDSWPLDNDFFKRVVRLAIDKPKTAVFAGSVYLPGSTDGALIPNDPDCASNPVSCFEGCACVIRRVAFLETAGYLHLRHAYGMEEADVSLQLLDAGWEIREVPSLRIFHDTQMTHHASPSVNAAHITNTALLAFLRYPKRLWPLGFLQVLNRVRYAIGAGRYAGILEGLITIPSTCWRLRSMRNAVKPDTLYRSRGQRRRSKSSD